MVSLPVAIHAKTDKTITIQVDRSRFERLADMFGLYRPEFLRSIDRSSTDIKAGCVKKLRSLKDLRKA